MDSSAMIFMGITWAVVVGLNIFCFGRILTKKNGPNSSGPNDER